MRYEDVKIGEEYHLIPLQEALDIFERNRSDLSPHYGIRRYPDKIMLFKKGLKVKVLYEGFSEGYARKQGFVVADITSGGRWMLIPEYLLEVPKEPSHPETKPPKQSIRLIRGRVSQI